MQKGDEERWRATNRRFATMIRGARTKAKQEGRELGAVDVDVEVGLVDAKEEADVDGVMDVDESDWYGC